MPEDQGLYDLINANVTLLLNTIHAKDDIDPYVELIRDLPKVDVSQNMRFQKQYSRYWALNAAHLGQDFLTTYFRLLERSKHAGENTTVERIARELSEIPSNSAGKHALQFSFASKLVHMVNPRLPVYDGLVETFYFLPRRYSGTIDDKLSNLLLSYNFLIYEHERIQKEQLLAPAIVAVRERFRLEADYTDEKIIDTIIWKFVGFLSKGALRDKSLAFK